MYVSRPFSPHLLVDGSNNGASHPHAEGEAAMEVLVEEERLDHGSHKQESGVEVPLPVRFISILREGDQ